MKERRKEKKVEGERGTWKHGKRKVKKNKLKEIEERDKGK